jgi:hypothetical protein
MPPEVKGFTSSTKLSGGHNGLIVTSNAASKLTINGSSLKNGDKVTVLYPAQSSNPTYQWEGPCTDTNSAGTQCTAVVTQKKEAKGRPTGDDPTTVSVTAGDSTPTNVNTYTGVAPP